MRLFFLFVICFLPFSISGQIKTEYYKEVNIENVKNYYSRYSIKIPDSWFSYYTDPNLMSHSPNKFKDSISPKKNYPSFIIREGFYKSKSNQKSVKFFIKSQKRRFSNFDYKIEREEHPLYGEYFVVLYKTLSSNNKIEVFFVTILNWNKQSYSFFYSSTDNYFDEHFKEVNEIISSFKISK